MTEEELDQIAAEIQELAQKSHWLALSPFSYVSEMGYIRKPDTMRFPATPQGLQEALAWLRQQATITWVQPGEGQAKDRPASGAHRPVEGDQHQVS